MGRQLPRRPQRELTLAGGAVGGGAAVERELAQRPGAARARQSGAAVAQQRFLILAVVAVERAVVAQRGAAPFDRRGQYFANGGVQARRLWPRNRAIGRAHASRPQ